MFTAKEFRARAIKLVGLRYILGAEWNDTPQKMTIPKAVDCSELVEGLFRENETPIGDLAAAQYNKTVAVKSGTERVGDLVFLKNNSHRANGIGHVAVLTAKLSNGDWEIVEARGHAAGVVRTTLSYWKKRKYFTGVRRFPKFALKAETLSTPPVPPVTTPVPPVTTSPTGDTVLSVAGYNGMDVRFDGKKNDDGKFLSSVGCSVYLLVEMNEEQRNNARNSFSGGSARWKVWDRNSQSIMFDSTKYEWSTSKKVTFGPTSYHGGIIAVLKRKDTGENIQFAVMHLPPPSVASDPTRKKWLDKFIAELDPDLPTVMGGDFNSVNADDWAKAKGFASAKDTAAKKVNADKRTVDPYKTGSLVYDYLFTKNRGVWEEYEVIDAKSSSDHNLVRGKIMIKSKGGEL